ncbi:MAG: hypothetical protein WAK04_04980 [Xanthobacteraceae bacterium]
MYKHSIANKYLPLALALAAITVAGTTPVLAQQSGWGAGISTRNATPYVHEQSINHRSGYSSYARITDHRRPDPFGVNGWFNR